MSFEPFEKNTAEILKLICIESFSHKYLFTFFFRNNTIQGLFSKSPYLSSRNLSYNLLLFGHFCNLMRSHQLNLEHCC